MINSKSKLAILLSKLKVFDSPMIREEQYSTDSEIAAEFLWNAYYIGDIKDKTIADFGSGTGILGIGALLLDAKKLFFVENDEKSMEIAKKNIFLAGMEKEFIKKSVFINKNIEKFNQKVDVVIENPPFGTKKKHADKVFLEKAFNTADIIYSFHKLETSSFVKKISEDNGFNITHKWNFRFPLKATQSFHKRKIHRINVSCFRMEIK
jgi:putative methylase